MTSSDTDGEGSDGSESRTGVFPEERWRRWLTLALLVVLALSLMGTVYFAVNPPETTDPYTEFYVLGTDGNASDYPTNLTTGQTGEFVVGITNHEHESMTYTVEANLSTQHIYNQTMTVGDEQTRETTVTFSPTEPGTHRLQIRLYKAEAATGEPDQTLRLWVRVRG